jgi:iron(III) transport system ATP-binding protein
MSLYLEQLVQRFDKTLALKEINLEIREGEFMAILGPSGCGKTTLLRSIGGFIQPSEGVIRKDDEIYSGKGRMVPVEERDLGMVFQSFALWPHMTVRQHVEFPMKSSRQKHLSSQEKRRAVERAIESMGLSAYADRLPGELSGGQRQRVALARAIVGKPSILLMDEPLSALDAELKVSMRREIQDIHRMTGATIIYVTHDQSEALAMADRILIMNQGEIEQLGTPQEVYMHPKTEFAAGFVSKCNMIRGIWEKNDFYVEGEELVYEGEDVAEVFRDRGIYPVRPEQFRISKGQAGLKAKIKNRQYNGREMEYALDCQGGLVRAAAGCQEIYEIGEEVRLAFSGEKNGQKEWTGYAAAV